MNETTASATSVAIRKRISYVSESSLDGSWRYWKKFPLGMNSYTSKGTSTSRQHPKSLTTCLWLICERITTSLMNSSTFDDHQLLWISSLQWFFHLSTFFCKQYLDLPGQEFYWHWNDQWPCLILGIKFPAPVSACVKWIQLFF